MTMHHARHPFHGRHPFAHAEDWFHGLVVVVLLGVLALDAYALSTIT